MPISNSQQISKIVMLQNWGNLIWLWVYMKDLEAPNVENNLFFEK